MEKEKLFCSPPTLHNPRFLVNLTESHIETIIQHYYVRRRKQAKNILNNPYVTFNLLFTVCAFCRFKVVFFAIEMENNVNLYH